MHILFVTGEYPPMEGGVGAYTMELARALVDHSVEAGVVTSVAAAVGPNAASDTISEAVPVYPVIDGWGWSMPGKVADLARTVNADWIHVQYQTAAFSMHPAVNFAPGRWRKQHPVAWTYHDLRVPYLFPKAGDRLRRWVTERPTGNADLVITTNEGDRTLLAGKTKHTLASIPIGSNITGITLSADERRARRAQRGYGDDHQLLAYFGFLNRSKGGLTLVDTLDRLTATHPNARLLMIGERVGASDQANYAYLQEVEAHIAELGLTDRVQWTGRQSDAEVAADLNACDVLIMPYEDGASLRRGTLMAGLANGCAIVTTTPQAPLPELVMERDVIYVAPGNADAAARMTARVLDNPWLREKLEANARARSALFDWSAIARRHVDLYTSLAAQR